MIVVDVGYPSIANMDAAMTQIGFVKTAESTSGSSRYRWGNDAEGKATIGYEDTRYLWYDFNGTDTDGLMDLPATNIKLCYEPLARGGIALGFSSNSDTPLYVAFIAPKSSADDWVFLPNNFDYCRMCDYSRNMRHNYNQISFYSSVGTYSNNIQICKVYNGIRFMDNIYRTLLQPQLTYGGNVRASIGNTDYLLIKNINGIYNAWALELPS